MPDQQPELSEAELAEKLMKELEEAGVELPDELQQEQSEKSSDQSTANKASDQSGNGSLEQSQSVDAEKPTADQPVEAESTTRGTPAAEDLATETAISQETSIADTSKKGNETSVVEESASQSEKPLSPAKSADKSDETDLSTTGDSASAMSQLTAQLEQVADSPPSTPSVTTDQLLEDLDQIEEELFTSSRWEKLKWLLVILAGLLLVGGWFVL